MSPAPLSPAPVSDAPSGEQHVLVRGPYRAVLTEVGACLRSLTHGGRDLVASWPQDAVRPLFRGAVLAPWPNRVRDGAYAWGGEDHRLALTEPERAAALHGLVAWLPWSARRLDDAGVELRARLWPQQGYPFLVDLVVRAALDERGLAWSLTATNEGPGAAPFGASVHPYLVAGPGRVDDWTVQLDAGAVLDVDPDRLLPDRAAPTTTDVTGTPLDLRGGRSMSGVELDHAYTGLGEATARVRSADGSGVAISWDGASRWVQVHTADRPEPEHHRVGLAVEPMTCPPDAFGTGTDLVTLEPGASHTASWRIEALPAR